MYKLFYKIKRVGISVFSAILIFQSSTILAQGNLLIIPRRVVFEGGKKTQDVNLANSGNDTAKYVISLVQVRMKDDGGFERITEPDSGQYFADKFIRFFPRRVLLAPGESQVIKVQLTKADKLLPGEYRSHIFFRAEPNEKPLGENESQKKDTTLISVRLTAVFGMTIPVIIRIGENNTRVSISDLSVLNAENDTIPIIKMKFTRTGNMSVYGDLTVTYISPKGNETQVSIAKGVAVYTPNEIRWFQVALEKKNSINYKTGKIRVNYSSQSGDKLAEGEIILK